MKSATIALLFILNGCTALGIVAYQVAGPPAVPAKFTPDQKPMLVLVENYQRQSTTRTNADLLARYIADQLSIHNVAPIISLDTLSKLREAEKDFATMSISAIGKAAGAHQVLYVQIIRSSVGVVTGGAALQGDTLVRVKLVNVASGNTLWPRDLSDGYEVSASAGLDKDSGRDARDVQQRLNVSLADQIAKLFYKWKPEW